MALTDNPAGCDPHPLYADVIVPRGLSRAFTYLIPPAIRGTLAVGWRVVVPFRATTVPAVVIALHSKLPPGVQRQHVREIQSMVNGGSDAGLSAMQLQLSRWLSERYLAPWGQCIKIVSPPSDLPARPRTKWVITPEGRDFLTSSEKVLPDGRGMLERLARRPSGLSWRTLRRSEGDSAERARAALLRRGLIAEREATAVAAPGCSPGPSRLTMPPLPPLEPVRARNAPTWQPPAPFLAHIRQLLDSGQLGIVVLHAFRLDRMNALLRAVHETLHRKRRVLILTGEVSRAREIAETLTHVGIGHVYLFHGNLPTREKALVWQAMRSDETTVVVGTRSASCTPVQGLGLVWVEEEEDPALKEEQLPRYHAREIARRRAQLDQAVLVLASAHPSLESVHAAKTGQAALWSVPVNKDEVSVEVVDLRRFPAGTVVSPPVVDGIRTALAERTLVILYLNRKGYASLLQCRACGESPSCPACSLALRFHKRTGSLICHYCGYRITVPDVCPACHAVRLAPVGAGTERVEEVLRQHFPHIRVGRMDGEAIRRGAQAEALLALARAGEIDVVVGTQMLFLYREIPRAGLVAVLYADAGLHMPDFRAAEHTYHALQEALSLSEANGRGRLIIQTYLPCHHAIQAVTQRNQSVFTDTELAFRQALHYPPFTHLVRLDVSGTSERHVKFAAERWAAALQGAQGVKNCGSVSVLGPAPAPMPRLRNRYHWQLLVRSDSQEEVLRVVRKTLPGMERLPRSGGIQCSVDVDPLIML